MSNSAEYNKTMDMLEQTPQFELEDGDYDSLTLSATISIAISLKRIADALEQPKITGGDFVMPELTPEQITEFQKLWAKTGSHKFNE